jgi:hypothetical protein
MNQIQMSPSLPFTNVSVVGVGRRAGAEPSERSAAKGAQSPTGDLVIYFCGCLKFTRAQECTSTLLRLDRGS